MLGPTITSSWTRRFVAHAEQEGLDVDPALAEIGISRALVQDPHGRAPYAQHVALVSYLTQRLDAPGLGCEVGRGADAAAFGVVGLLAESCSTLGEALVAIRRFNSVANEASSMDFRREGGRLVVQDAHTRDGRPMPHPVAEATMAFYVSMIRHTTGVDEPLAELWLAHREHAGWARAPRAHFAAKVRFDQPVNALVLPAAMWDAPFSSARPELEHQLARLAVHLERDLAPSVVPMQRLRARIRASLGYGGPEPVERAARAMGKTARTLQRELEAAGSSYRELVDEVRRDTAKRLLLDSELGLSVMAERVGYSEPRAFRRACARWFGTTPARIRADGA